MWRSAILMFALGCTEHGRTPPGGLPDAGAGQVGPFSAQLCTSGSPGDPGCPINVFPLDDLGARGASFQFELQALSGSLFMTAAIDPGANTLHVVHPEVLIVPAGGMPQSTGDAFASFDSFIATPTLLPDTTFMAQTTDQLIIRFGVLETL